MRRMIERTLTISLVLLLILLSPGTIAHAKSEQSSKADFAIIGSYVFFGSYEQDNNHGNGKEPIEWLVLEVKGSKSLLISRYGLDAVPYYYEWADITWEKSSIRSWLNKDFLNDGFDKHQQAAILTTQVDNSKKQGNPEWDTLGGKDTQDKVFLLSVAEAKQYFKDDESRTTLSTTFAKALGAETGLSNDPDIWWWLRSPGFYQRFAALVDIDGTIYSGDADAPYMAVRPVIWVDTNSKIFP